ncbi:MAG: hypothetical protein M1607_00350 [Patescibacteria group bacterium]|nr:hypothetical protein [Patescibacteria group bacterium]
MNNLLRANRIKIGWISVDLIPVLLFFDWRLMLLSLASMSHFFINMGINFLGKEFGTYSLIPQLWIWANFDGSHYLSIVNYGYGQFEYAFFPGYPVAVWLVSRILPDPLLVALLVSNVAALIFVYLLYKLWLLDYSSKEVNKSLFLLLAFPTAFFLGAVYSESLFLCFAVGSFYAVRKHNYLLAGFLGILATTTRLVGIMLIPALLILWYQQKQKIKSLWAILAIGLGILLVMMWNWWQTGDLLYFFHVQPMFGAQRSGGQIVLLPQTIYRYFKIFLTTPFSLTLITAVEEFVLTLGVLLLLIVKYKKINLAYLIFSLGVLLLPTLTGTLSSMPRYLLAAFPLFPLLGSFLNNKFSYRAVIFLLAIWQIINLALFVNGYWVA